MCDLHGSLKGINGMKKEEFAEKAVEMGAYKAGLMQVDKITFDEGLRSYCEANYCGSFGRNYACPPMVGGTDEVIAKAKEYPYALVFQTVGELEDSYDVEGMEEAKEKHEKLAEQIRSMVEQEYRKHLSLTAGGCPVCKTCAALEQKPCRFPERAVSSLEAYCMNVSDLAGKCGMKYINGKDTVTYFGAVLF